MPSSTLTSLAMLKVNIDQGRDYLDYLRPFILQVLCDHTPDPVTDGAVRDFIRSDFGLEIPARAVQTMLKRLSREDNLTRAHGVYSITGKLTSPNIGTEKVKAEKHIHVVVSSLREFSSGTPRPITSDEEAIEAICGFLLEFNIPCLRAYLRSTAIPVIEKHDDALIVLVSKFVLSILENDRKLFDSFMVVAQGHMLANALLCPDLSQAPQTYKRVAFYFDTPLLVRCLGLEGPARKAAVENLIHLLQNLGATLGTFSHSRDELERVVRTVSDFIELTSGRGPIVMEARRSGTTRSDLLLMAGQIDEMLNSAGINVIRTPHYRAEVQIDERAFEHALRDEVTHNNPRALEDDINSVRSIYVLRSGASPRNVESARAVLVTSNSGFAQAAYEYGKEHESFRDVSSVITDFSLANMAWLKAPLSTPNLPMTEVIAFSYGALQPSSRLLDKYLAEIDKLEKRGNLTAAHHQLLRSEAAQRELMNLTLGEDDALTEQTVTETLERVVTEIKREENEKYQAEKAAHEETLEQLESEQARQHRLQSILYWRCDKRSRVFAWMVSSIIGALVVSGILAGAGLTATNAILGWTLVTGGAVLIITTLCNIFLGVSIVKLHGWIQAGCLTWLLKRESLSTGFDFDKLE